MNAKLCDSPSTKTVQLCAACCMMREGEAEREASRGGKRERQRVCCVLAYLPRLAVACQASKLAVSDKDNIMAAAAVAAVAVAVAEAAIKTFTLLGVTFPAANSCHAPPPSSLSLSTASTRRCF